MPFSVPSQRENVCLFVTVKFLHGYLCFTKGVTQMATENKMGVMPLNRLLISMSVPMMISMLVQALYNIVDSMFVAQLSENALTAVSLAFPAQNLMIAVATGTGVGVNAALSRNLGEKNFDRANRIADHALFLAAMSYIVFALFGLFFARQFFRLQTDIEEIVDLGTTYLRVCTIASFGLFMEIAYSLPEKRFTPCTPRDSAPSSTSSWTRS